MQGGWIAQRLKSYPTTSLGAPHPGFPAKFGGIDALHAAFLNESRTRGRLLVPVQEIRVSRSFFARCGSTAALPLTVAAQQLCDRGFPARYILEVRRNRENIGNSIVESRAE